jgi:hypothetical protein
MLRYQGFEVEDYVFTLDALPLKPSFFCNTGDYSGETFHHSRYGLETDPFFGHGRPELDEFANPLWLRRDGRIYF